MHNRLRIVIFEFTLNVLRWMEVGTFVHRWKGNYTENNFLSENVLKKTSPSRDIRAGANDPTAEGVEGLSRCRASRS